MKRLSRFDRSVYKYNPDQTVLRLNEIVDSINNMGVVLEQSDNTINSKLVIVYGRQPDGTFGIAKWTKDGDTYTNKVTVI